MDLVNSEGLQVGMPVSVEPAEWLAAGASRVGVVKGIADGYPAYTNKSVTIAFEDWSGFKALSLNIPRHVSGFKLLKDDAGLALIEKYNRWSRGHLEQALSSIAKGTSGCDPEVFVVQDDVLIPAYKFLPSKQYPLSFKGMAGAWSATTQHAYWDGFQAEFTTCPMGCLCDHTDSIRAGLKEVWKQAREKFPRARLSLKNVFPIPQDTLANEPGEYIDLGCSPSYNAYSIKGQEIVDPRALPIRFAGGHIHIGRHFGVGSNIQRVVKAIDRIAGIATISMFAAIDDADRRRYYGLPGEYRLPVHGLEYRVLSNAWLTHPAICMFTFDLVRWAAKVAEAHLEGLWEGDEKEIVSIIQNCDVKAARALINKNQNSYMGMLRDIYNGQRVTTTAKYGADVQAQCVRHGISLIQNGVESVVKDPANIEGNWQFGADWTPHAENIGVQWHSAVRNSLSKGQLLGL